MKLRKGEEFEIQQRMSYVKGKFSANILEF